MLLASGSVQPLLSLATNANMVKSYALITTPSIRHWLGGIFTIIHNVFTGRRRPPRAVDQENEYPEHFLSEAFKNKIKMINKCDLMLQDLKHFKTVIMSSYKMSKVS